MSQRDGELTLRLRRVLREVTNEKADVFEKVAAVALTIGMVSILTVQMFWDTDNEFVHAATIHDPEIQPQLLQTLWQAASREAETVIAALAKIATVAARYGKAKAGRQVTQQWSTQAPAWPQPGKRRRANQSLRGRDTPAACAEEAKLEEALQLALSLADDIGTDSSQRLLQLRTSVVPQSEQVAILRTLFLHKARVASTLMHNIRAIARLRTWATSKGLSPWQLNTMEIAFFLRDASHGRLSVPKSLLSAMEWLQSALQLPWQLKDPAVVAVAACSARQASVLRTQATPYTYEVCLDLLHALEMVEDASAPAFAILFFLCLAFACLRFSDLDRSVNLQLGRDALHGTTWRSKGKAQPTPWAALRRTWDDYDWGGKFFKLLQESLPQTVQGQPRDWVWPAMFLDQDGLNFCSPIRHGSYSNCLMAMGWAHKFAGHNEYYTLHSPRFFICGIAGQAGFTMEQRRSLGRWGPASGMPVRYDQSRCCAELAAKQTLWEKLATGFVPGHDFELPALDADKQDLVSRANAAKSASLLEQDIPTKRKPKAALSSTEELPVIINHRTAVVHRDPPCQNVKDPSLHHYERTIEKEENMHLYVKCVRCFARNLQMEYPKWEDVQVSEDSSETSSSTSSTGSDTSRSASAD